MKPRNRLALAALGLWLAAWNGPAASTGMHPAVARFDALVTGGLPGTLSAIAPLAHTTASPEQAAGPLGQPAPARRLQSHVILSDGSPAVLYEAAYRGRDAMAVRHGDALRISVVDEEGIHATGFTAGSPGAMESFRPLAGSIGMPAIDTDAPPAPPYLAKSDAPVDSDEGAGDESNEFALDVYVHDDVFDSDEELLESFFAWWIKRMEFDVLEDRTIRIQLYRGVPGVTDARYGFPGALLGLGDAMWSLRQAHRERLPGLRRHYKQLLLVRNMPEPGVAGLARGSQYAMASTSGSYGVPAHELGHLMGATHEDAQIKWISPFNECNTLMWPSDNRYPCRHYSPPNVARIRQHMGYVRPRW